MLITYNGLVQLVQDGVIENVEPSQINAASIDVRLGSKILVEDYSHKNCVMDFRARDEMHMREVIIPEEGIEIPPGGIFLAQTLEKFNLPNDVAAEFKLKSSTARRFLQHMLAGWCDPGWHGSVLTLEFQNASQHHWIRLRTGDAVGQVVFFNGEAVPQDRSYAVRGRYNNDASVSQVKK